MFECFLSENMPPYIMRLLLLTTLLIAGKITAQEPQWFRGNTHTHSLWSDGNDFPEMITDFYVKNGYQFLVFSDHNVLSQGEKWMNVAALEKRKRTLSKPALEKYITRFGKDHVQLRGEGKEQEVRLKTLEETRAIFEKADEFIFIEGEEITGNFNKIPIHINGINLKKPIAPPKGTSITDVIRKTLQAVNNQSLEEKRPMLAHINHPNFQWALKASDIAPVLEEKFIEVYNGHPGINHLGDATRPGDELIWDTVNTIRVKELNAPLVYGVATDDSHTYHGGDVRPGRGWVMVQASELKPDAIVNAMHRGDFYASSGVTLKAITFDPIEQQMHVIVDAVEGEKYTIDFIGTRRRVDGKIGEILQTSLGDHGIYTVTGDEYFIRARVTSSSAHNDPSYPDQKKQAWTQPRS
jgi:hypothetical protein